MSTLVQHLGRFQAAHAAAGDPDSFRRFGFGQSPFLFPSQLGIAQAGNKWPVLQITESIIAALVAAYAVDNILGAPLQGFVEEFRIGQLGAAHNHHVGLALFQNVLGQFRGVDTAYRHGNHAGFFPI